MLLQDVLQNVVVAVCVGPQVLYLRVAPIQTGGSHAMTVFRTGQPVYGGVRAFVVQPLAVVDAGVCGVFARNEGKRSDDAGLFVQTDIAVTGFDIFPDQFTAGIASCPLFQVAAFPHDTFALFEDIHQAVQVFHSAFSDLYCHNAVNVSSGG